MDIHKSYAKNVLLEIACSSYKAENDHKPLPQIKIQMSSL